MSEGGTEATGVQARGDAGPSWLGVVPFALLALALVAVSRVNYLLFHSLVELAFSVLALATFFFAWQARRLGSAYLTFVGLVLGCVGGLNLFHVLAYRGMGVFPDHGANLATQLWIAERGLLAVGLVLAPRFLDRPLAALPAAGVLAAVTAALLWLPLSGRFPDCWVEGVGLTPFKRGAEVVISALLLLAMLGLVARRQHLDPRVFQRLLGFLALSILAELVFTTYLGVYDAVNAAGHLLALVSTYVLYRAVLWTSVTRPYTLLFRQLSRALDEQRVLSTELAQALRHRDDFLSLAAHELRSPLTSLGLNLDLVERAQQDVGSTPRLARALATSQRQVVRLAELIDDLLDVSRIRQGRLTYTLAPARLDHLVTEVAERSREQLQAVGSALTVQVQGPLEAVCDRSRVEQVLVNLLTNASKYAPGAPVTVRLLRDGAHACLEVEDAGPGIPLAEQARLFEAFTRASNARGKGGLGLGLYLVEQVARAHGGRVTLASAPGQGARFRVELPLAPGGAREAKA